MLMSILDKMVAAVTPPESEEARREARSRARASSTGSADWLGMVLDHHEQIEAAFAAVRSAEGAGRTLALRQLAVLLTGHSNAEESVLYPAMARADEKGHALMAYGEQATAKMQMGLLEGLPPMSQEFLDKLEHIRGAVVHHMYSEEDKWFPELVQATLGAEQSKLGQRYQEEFDRYVGGTTDWEDEPRMTRSGT
jgi:hemerythrin superfamily protein